MPSLLFCTAERRVEVWFPLKISQRECRRGPFKGSAVVSAPGAVSIEHRVEVSGITTHIDVHIDVTS